MKTIDERIIECFDQMQGTFKSPPEMAALQQDSSMTFLDLRDRYNELKDNE